jgi:hypothetical protein
MRNAMAKKLLALKTQFAIIILLPPCLKGIARQDVPIEQETLRQRRLLVGVAADGNLRDDKLQSSVHRARAHAKCDEEPHTMSHTEDTEFWE